MIDSFRGEYHWLSNFDETPFYIGPYRCKSVEHAYQAYKAFKSNQDELGDKILNAETPGISKKLGRTATLPPDWEEIKLSVMISLLLSKFCQNRHLCEKLIATGDQELVEGNWWGDKYWGVCNGEGENWLGKALMSIRDTINEQGLDKWIEKTSEVHGARVTGLSLRPQLAADMHELDEEE